LFILALSALAISDHVHDHLESKGVVPSYHHGFRSPRKSFILVSIFFFFFFLFFYFFSLTSSQD